MMGINFSEVDGVIFDLDGTLVASSLDFRAIKTHLQCPLEQDILIHIDSLTDPHQQQLAHQYILDQELADAQQARWLSRGQQLVAEATQHNLPMAIVTRNSIAATQLKISNNQIPISLVITCEDAPPKPDPTALLSVANQWQIPASRCLYVGDFIYDQQAAQRAGMQFLMV